MLRNYWYPMVRSADVPSDRPVAVELFGEPLVVFRDEAAVLHCLEDRCGHRSAPLSLGILCKGRVECPYHGWQYGARGRCEHIPTLADAGSIPRGAHVSWRAVIERAGLIWIWAGAPETADESKLPSYPEFSSPEWWVVTQGTIDLAVDHSLVIENLLDPTHVSFTHRGTLSKPEEAQPLVVTVTETQEGGLIGRFQATREPKPRLPEFFAFDAPCHVRVGKDDHSVTRLFHCLPVAQSRMRMIWWIALRRSALSPELARKVANEAERLLVEKQYFDGQMSILKQDVEMLLGQQRRIELGANSFACPLKGDGLAYRYRQWREANDVSGTWFEGYASAGRRRSAQANVCEGVVASPASTARSS